MKKLSVGCGRFCIFPSSAYASCSPFCLSSSSLHDQQEDTDPLITQAPNKTPPLKLKDVINATAAASLAFQLKPKKVVLRVSMHCAGCARKVEKHISKIDGVSSYEVDLETKMVVVIGDILPYEVLESVSKVKHAELWNTQSL